MTHTRHNRMFKFIVTAMTLWLLTLVLWSAATQRARSAQTATHATRTIFTPTPLPSVTTPQEAITVLKAASIAQPTN